MNWPQYKADIYLIKPERMEDKAYLNEIRTQTIEEVELTIVKHSIQCATTVSAIPLS